MDERGRTEAPTAVSELPRQGEGIPGTVEVLIEMRPSRAWLDAQQHAAAALSPYRAGDGFVLGSIESELFIGECPW